MRPVKKVALIHDICSIGKASLTNMMPILGKMGVESCPIPTMLLSTHTGGYGDPAVHRIPGQYLRETADHYKEQGIDFDLLFVGYVGSKELLEDVIYFIESFPETKLVVDPIMGDQGKLYSLFSEDYPETLIKLLPYADVLLPNLTEAYFLAKEEYKLPTDHRQLLPICERLTKLGAKNLIITSVPKDDCNKGMILYENHAFLYIGNGEEQGEYHGAGDAFDGMFIAKYVQGYSLLESVQAAHAFVCACIRESEKYDYPERDGLLIETTLNKL